MTEVLVTPAAVGKPGVPGACVSVPLDEPTVTTNVVTLCAGTVAVNEPFDTPGPLKGVRVLLASVTQEETAADAVFANTNCWLTAAEFLLTTTMTTVELPV
ncbi:hypothetical protein GCM10023238_08910 [Streptomyces heliomycini]